MFPENFAHEIIEFNLYVSETNKLFVLRRQSPKTVNKVVWLHSSYIAVFF
jgi:hypothetical protein